MRLSRFLAVTSALLLAAALALITTGSAHASGPAYVALGDSYSAGVGSGGYDRASGDCHRSSKAYPALWAAAHHPSGFSFAACSGATTSRVVNSQLGTLSPDTRLVSITVGGNDAGFSDVMTTCVLYDTRKCLRRVDTANTFIEGTLPGRLDAVYDAIRAKAPQARVVVLGYPRFYRLGAARCLDISERKRAAIDGAADLVDSVIEKRAADHGFAFGDVRGTFTGHELCTGSPWMHSLTNPLFESYHPTAHGQSGGYLPLLTAAS